MRLVILVTGGLLAATLALAPAAEAATGTVHTRSGSPLTIRSGPHTSSAAVGSLAEGTSFTIDCQAYGDTVTGKYGTSRLWDHVAGRRGYVSDAYVYTGADGRVAPLCGSSGPACSTTRLGDPRTCTQAVAWAKAHYTTRYHADYYRRCDHVTALAYGWSASGSTSAYRHWTQIPAALKHPGVRSVPAGGLAFFSTGTYGHVMISVGGGRFMSNDIHGRGTYTYTTINEIVSKWGAHYLGWAQPWFKVNH
jgi:uncharacterized protein YraI